MTETKVDIKNEYESQTWKRGDKLFASDITKMSKTIDTVENALIEINEDVIPAVAAASKQNSDQLTSIQPKIDQIDVPEGTTVGQYVDRKVADLVGAAPETLDTIQEIADALQNDAGVVGALQTLASSNRVRVEQVENRFNAFESEFEQHVTDAPKYTVLSDRKVIQLANNDGIDSVTTAGISANLVSISADDIVEIGSSQANLNINTAGKITINGTTNEVASKDDVNDCYNTITGETDEKLTLYATKSALQALDNGKADKATTLAGYGIEDAYTKDEVDGLISAVYRLKGSVDTVDDLPADNNVIGDVYNVTDSGMNYVYTETGWDALGSIIDLGAYAKSADVSNQIAAVDAKFANYTTTVDVNAALETKANSGDVYGKSEIDDKFADYTNTIDFNAALELKADKTALSDYATITSVNAALADKADSSDVYTKSEVDTKIADVDGKLASYTTTADLNDQLALKADVSAVQQVDDKFADYMKTVDVTAAIATKANAADVYNKTEVDDKLANVVTDNNSYKNVVSNASEVVAIKSSLGQLLARVQQLETPVIVSITAEPGTSVSQPDSDVVYSGDLVSDGTNTASTTVITAKSVQLNAVTTTNNAIAITATNNVAIDNLTTEGSIAKSSDGGRNAGVSIDSGGYVTITGGTWNAENYNAIEIGLNGTVAKGVNIDGLTVNGKLANNAISIFDWAENATITVSNCHFADVSNVIRVSNKSNVPATFNFVNCTVDKWETNPTYAGFLLMEDYTSQTADQAATENRFHNIKITFTNCVGPNGVKLVGSGADFNNPDHQWAYLYCDNGGIVAYDADRWPTIVGV